MISLISSPTRLYLFCWITIVNAILTGATYAQTIDKTTFSIHKGVNISHWLSQSNRRGPEREAYFQEEDVAFIASCGFDHIRLPIDEEHMWDSEVNRDYAAFRLLHNALGWCKKYQLKCIVDLHILRSHHFNAMEKPLWTDPNAQAHFLKLWESLSEQLKQYPVEDVAYELMNEPVADDPQLWNTLLKRGIETVRKNEPERKLVIGSNRWQSTETFDVLQIPHDPNLIISFHFYEPFLITHYRAPWTAIGKYSGPVSYPGKAVAESDLDGLDSALIKAVTNSNRNLTPKTLEKRILKPLKFARKHGLPVYCGEWGAMKTTPESTYLAWYKDIRKIFDKHQIAWTIWDYRGSFGIRDRDRQPYQNLIDVLTK